MTLGRITNQMVTNQLLDNLNRSQQSMQTLEQQLSSGRRITQPSDDPYGASLAVSLQGQLARLSDYASNVSDGTAWTSAGMSAMSNITEQLQRAQELVTGARNGSQPASALKAAGAEIDQLIDGIKSDANAQYNGQYIFGGAKTQTAPYDSADDTYAGDTGDVPRTIGADTTVTVNAQLDDVLGGADGLIAKLRSVAAALNSGTPPAADALTGLSDSLTALNRQQATLGATADRLSLAATRISSLQTSTTAALSDDQDVDYPAAITAFSNEQAAFTAALRAGANIVQTSLMDFLGSS